MKELTGTFRPKTGVINNSAGQTVTEAEEIKKQWEEYTKELYRRDPDMLDTFFPHEYNDEPNILESKVRSAMKALPNHNTAGLDNIPFEFFKPPNEEIVRVLRSYATRSGAANVGQKTGKQVFTFRFLRKEIEKNVQTTCTGQ